MSTDHAPGSRADDELARALAAVSTGPVPAPADCLVLAKAYEKRGDQQRAAGWACAATDTTDDFGAWLSASRIIKRCRPFLAARAQHARVAVLGSYTTTQLTSLLPLAAARAGLDIDVFETDYGQYRIDLLTDDSAVVAFRPDVVVLAVHEAEVSLPAFSDEPEAAVARELSRWTSLWQQIADRTGAHIVQHTFAIPPEVGLGHLAASTPGSRYAMLHRLNARLGEVASGRVSLVDCDRLAAVAGKYVWFDARYYHLAKQAVGLNAVPLLARHTGAVIAARLGLAKKCLVLDLDNTLWGGILGEVGFSGIAVGSGPVGEAYTAFQRYILALKDRGVILAICSKNDEAAVREVFTRHPDMSIRLEHIAMLAASWEDKPAAIRRIAATLGIGLDSLVFVDDNPAEREAVRQLVPEVDVVPLPADPAGYVKALSSYPFFETAALTAEDRARTQQYKARADISAGQQVAETLEDFLLGLDMQMRVTVVDETNAARVAQLINKTNQFNVTTRRRSEAQVRALIDDDGHVTQVVRLRDRFADHGIIGVLLARRSGADVLDVDTWLLSCRVLGRGVEDEMMQLLIAEAEREDVRVIRGTYVPSARNSQVADLFSRLGFVQTETGEQDGTTHWVLHLPAGRPATPGHILVEQPQLMDGMSR